MTLRTIVDAHKALLDDQQRRQLQQWVTGSMQQIRASHGRVPDGTQLHVELEYLTYMATGNQDVLRDPVDYERLVAEGLADDSYLRMRANKAAKERFDAEQAEQIEMPAPLDLGTFIDNALTEEEHWRIADLWPAGGRILLAAQYKAGKTTLIANLIRSLVDGHPFLGKFRTSSAGQEPPYTAGVLLIDTEMTAGQLGRWFHAQGIENKDAVEVLTLRGQLSGFNILTPEGRQAWAQAIEGAEVVILDNLRPVLDGLGLDENREAGRFLTAWDELMAEMGVSESLIVTHTGHNGERARGDSALLASNDGMWTIVRQDPDDLASLRFFRAYGRGFDQPEALLQHDPDTGRLELGDGNRKSAKAEYMLDDVLDFLVSSGGTSTRGVRAAIKGDQKAISAALELGVNQGLIERRQGTGRGGGFAHFLTEEGQAAAPRNNEKP